MSTTRKTQPSAEVLDLRKRLRAIRRKFLRHIEDTCDTSRTTTPPRDLFERATDLRVKNWIRP